MKRNNEMHIKLLLIVLAAVVISVAVASSSSDYPLAASQYAKYNIVVPDQGTFIKFFEDANALKPVPAPAVMQCMYIVKLGAAPGASRFMIPNVQSFMDVEGIMMTTRTFDNTTGQLPKYTVQYMPMSWSTAGGRYTYVTYDLNQAWGTYSFCINCDLALWENYLKR